jgi:outer membrane protein
MRRIVVAAVAALTFAGVAYADAEEPNEAKKPSWLVGAGMAVAAKPYEGMSAKVYPIPLFGYEGERLYVRGISAGYRLFVHDGWSLGPVVRIRFDGYEADDSDDLDGMDDRDGTINGGLEVTRLTDWGLIGLSFVNDLLGRHDGHDIEVSYTIRFGWQRWDIIPSVALCYRSEDLVDYYYGVKADEARSGRPAYVAGEALNPSIRLAARRDVSERWQATVVLQYEWYDSEISDSPIVDDDGGMSYLLGVTYSF